MTSSLQADSAATSIATTSTTPPPTRKRRRPSLVLLLTVLLPTVLAALYYGVVASDVYTSESRFVVHNPQRAVQGGLGALLQGTALARSQDDAYSVHDFVRSRDALAELDSKLQLRQAYSQASIDLVNRFPGPEWWDTSFEALHRHYLKHLQIDYDTASSISVVRVRAYTAADAQRINETVLQMGERLVNNLNQRSRSDLINTAAQEVKAAESRVREAALALSGYRNERHVYDPNSQSALQLQGVARLQEELLASETQLAQLRTLSPDNPQVQSLASRVASLRKTMAAEAAKVTGGSGSFSAKLPAYDRLVLEKGFADRQLAGALAALDTARSEATRKQLYLERLVQPNLPDKATEPRRFRSVVMVFLLGLVVWATVSLVIASVREHVD